MQNQVLAIIRFSEKFREFLLKSLMLFIELNSIFPKSLIIHYSPLRLN